MSRRRNGGWWTDVADALSALRDWLAPYALVAVCLLILVMSVRGLGSSWAANTGHGVTGRFTAEERHCSKSGCSWRGTFVGRDGSVRTGVRLGFGGPDIDEPGQSVVAIDTGDDTRVFAEGGGGEWVFDAVIVLGSAVGLVIGATWIAERFRGPRRRRSPGPGDWFRGS